MKHLILFLFLLIQWPAAAFQGTQEKIQRYKPYIDSLSMVYGIPSKLIIGVGICESGLANLNNPSNRIIISVCVVNIPEKRNRVISTMRVQRKVW